MNGLLALTYARRLRALGLMTDVDMLIPVEDTIMYKDLIQNTLCLAYIPAVDCLPDFITSMPVRKVDIHCPGMRDWSVKLPSSTVVLDLSCNQLSELPPTVTPELLPELRELTLSNNNIASWPDMRDWRNLSVLSTSGNMEAPPTECVPGHLIQINDGLWVDKQILTNTRKIRIRK